MQFKYFIGTKVLFGKDCVQLNKNEFGKLGKRAQIITGCKSAKESGALGDVCSALNDQGIEYGIYDKIRNNPSLEAVGDGGRETGRFEADFIIGIGGGSPIDAAKAIAVLAVNDINPLDLYKNSFANKPLPVVAIPTTAGTGSEVTPYSILTRDDLQTKMSFGNEETFPRLALLDARYTESMPYNVTVHTAVDALTHAVEGYLGRKSTPLSDIFALEAIDLFGQCLDNLVNNSIDSANREKLLYMSMLGGMVIAHTGTTIMHGMGYNLTYFKGLPHGQANGLLMKEYFRFNYEAAKDRIDRIFELLKVKDINEFGKVMDGLMCFKLQLKEEEIRKYAALTMHQKSTLSNIRTATVEDIAGLYSDAFGGNDSGLT